jgi:molybdate/tungstate transport system substrate-binding protein
VRRPRTRLAALLVAAAAIAAGAIPASLAISPAGAASRSRPASAPPQARAAGKGTVKVLYAGSLVNYMENNLGPAFQKATGYGYEGFGGGSTEVANEIRGGVRQGDVFISASAKADQALQGSAGGNWVSWYSTFAGTPLMLGYNPHSSFGRQLAHGKPWYQVVTEPGILVGRTDPKLDPKGVLTSEAVATAARKLHDPKLASALGSFPVYPETALVGRLQSGQLDAGFFYAVEASSAHFPTVKLTPVYKYALYTVTILSHAANPAGAAAFVRYLLNSARTSTLERNGIVPSRPTLSGNAAAVPGALRRIVGAG